MEINTKHVCRYQALCDLKNLFFYILPTAQWIFHTHKQLYIVNLKTHKTSLTKVFLLGSNKPSYQNSFDDILNNTLSTLSVV